MNLFPEITAQLTFVDFSDVKGRLAARIQYLSDLRKDEHTFLKFLEDNKTTIDAITVTKPNGEKILSKEKAFKFARTYDYFCELCKYEDFIGRLETLRENIRRAEYVVEELTLELQEKEYLENNYPVLTHSQPYEGDYAEYLVIFNDPEWTITASTAYSFDGEEPKEHEYSFLTAVKGQHRVRYCEGTLLANTKKAGKEFMKVCKFDWSECV